MRVPPSRVSIGAIVNYGYYADFIIYIFSRGVFGLGRSKGFTLQRVVAYLGRFKDMQLSCGAAIASSPSLGAVTEKQIDQKGHF